MSSGFYLYMDFNTHVVLGGHNIALVLGTYQPNLNCRGTFDTWRSCRSVLGDMPVQSQISIFGRRGNPDVQYVLPQTIISRQ